MPAPQLGVIGVMARFLSDCGRLPTAADLDLASLRTAAYSTAHHLQWAVALASWAEIAQESERCHTRVAWEALFACLPPTAVPESSQPLKVLFRRLASDACSQHYDPAIWATLINACLMVWDLPLAATVADHCDAMTSPKVVIAVAKVRLDHRDTKRTKSLVRRARKFSHVSGTERTLLELFSVTAAGMEQQLDRATAAYERLAQDGFEIADDVWLRGDVEFERGRGLYYLGRYAESAECFEKAAAYFAEPLSPARRAAALFNAAVNLQNCANAKTPEHINALLQASLECATRYQLSGPVASAAGFLGVHAGNCGHYETAVAYLTTALEATPEAGSAARVLHLRTCLVDSCIDAGRARQAERHWHQIEQAADAVSCTADLRPRIAKLKTKMAWLRGDVDAVEAGLPAAFEHVRQCGSSIVDNVSLLSTLVRQAAFLGLDVPEALIDALNHEKHRHWSTAFSLAVYQLTSKAPRAASPDLTWQKMPPAEDIAATTAFRLIELLQAIHCGGIDLDVRLAALLDVSSQMGPSHFDADLAFARAAVFYRGGDLASCRTVLKSVIDMPRASVTIRNVARSWLAGSPVHSRLLDTMTRLFFRPSVTQLSDTRYSVSGQYIVDLKGKPRMIAVAATLFRHPEAPCRFETLHRDAWEIEATQRRWESKVDGVLGRLNQEFQSTLALMIRSDGSSVSLNTTAISMRALPARTGTERPARIVEMLSRGPASSAEVGAVLAIPAATVKRMIGVMIDDGVVRGLKTGRRIRYELSTCD